MISRCVAKIFNPLVVTVKDRFATIWLCYMKITNLISYQKNGNQFCSVCA